MEWEKIFVSHRSQKKLTPKIQMEHIQLKNDYNKELTKDGERVETQCQTLFFGAPKSLQMVIAATKSKDACSLEGKM